MSSHFVLDSLATMSWFTLIININPSNCSICLFYVVKINENYVSKQLHNNFTLNVSLYPSIKYIHKY